MDQPPLSVLLLKVSRVLLERVPHAVLLRWARIALVVLAVEVSVAAAPMAVPMLPVKAFIRYTQALGVRPKTEEHHRTGPLSQFFADMHGWKEIVARISRASRDVRSEVSGRWAVFNGNYGVAGAVDFPGEDYGLPPAISGHNNYWLWGPGDPPPENLVIVGGPSIITGTAGRHGRRARRTAPTDCTCCMPSEDDNPIRVRLDLQADPDLIWPEVKHFE